MRFALKILAFCLTVLLILVAGVLVPAVVGKQGVGAGPDLGSAAKTVVDGFFTVNLIDAGSGKYVLVDAGNDVKGTRLLAALQGLGKGPADVAAIFITHAHPDHDAAIALFPGAEIYAMKDEVGIAAGTEAYRSPISNFMGKFNPHPFRVTHPLTDGEKVTVGSAEITAYALPGHTPGSAAYLIGGVLYLGDAAGVTSGGRLTGPVWLFSNDAAQGVDSLIRLAGTLKPRSQDIKFIVTSHNGNLSGLQPLLDLAGK